MPNSSQEQYLNEIKERNQQLYEVLERITDGFIALDTEWRFTYLNPSASKITGMQLNQVLYKSIYEYLPIMYGSVFEEQFKKASIEQTPVHFIAYTHSFQKWFDLSVYPSATGLSIFFRDIDEKKRSEEELRRFSLVAQQTNNIVAFSSPERRILWVNAAFCRFTGYSAEEAIGKEIGQVFDGPDTDPATISYVQERFRKQEPFHVEVLNYKKNGETYWADVYSQPVFDEEGKLEHFFSIASDITERKKLQHILNEEKKKRQQLITSVAIAAQERERSVVGRELHDNVNQVLTTIKLYMELCREGHKNQEVLLDKGISLLQDTIEEIRGLSKRLSAPSLGSIKLKDSVRELADSIATTNKIRISIDTTAIENLEVSEEIHLALYRILQEQFTNILKYAEASHVRITLDLENDHVILQVKDNGRGFDPREKRKGIGITNMITRAESLKGSFTLNSSPGKGCELLVCLPLN